MPEAFPEKTGLRLLDPNTKVLLARKGVPQVTVHSFGRGQAMYMSGFTYSPAAARMLLNWMLYLTGKTGETASMPLDSRVESAFFPASRTLVALNNAEADVETEIAIPSGKVSVSLKPLEMRFEKLK